MFDPEHSDAWGAFVQAHVWKDGKSVDAAGATGSITELLRGDPQAKALAVRLRYLTESIAHKVAGPGGDGIVSAAEIERFGRRLGRAAGGL